MNKNAMYLKAAEEGNLVVLRFLIECGFDPCFHDKRNGSILHVVCKKGFEECFDWFVSKVCKMEVPNEQDMVRTSRCGYDEMRPTPILSQVHSGRTPFVVACGSGHLRIAQKLYQLGALLKGTDKLDSHPVHEAVKNGYLEVVQWLARIDGIDMLWLDFLQRTAFYIACECGQLEVAQWLHNFNPAWIDAINIKNRTPITAACRKGHLAVVK